MAMFTRTAAVVQLIIVSLIVIYASVSFYQGNFEAALAPFPFLLFYYVFVVARIQRRKRREEAEGDDESDT